MNKAPRVLSNEGKDMSYSLWVSQNHEWSLARIYIKHGGNYTEEYVKTVYSRASFGYFKSRKDNGLLKHPKCESCQNVFRLFVGYDGRLLVHQKRPEKRRDIEKNEEKKSKDQPIQTCQNILNCLQRAVETLILAMTFRDDETWDERHTWDFKLPWPSVKVWKIADLIIGAGKHPPGGTSCLPARRDYSFAKWPDFCQTIDLAALFAYNNFRKRTRHLSWSRRERVRIGSLLIILSLLTSNPIRQMIIEGNF